MTKLKMRPMLSLLLALLMVVTALPMTALAADVPDDNTDVPATTLVESDSLEWELEDDGTLYISGSGYIERINSANEQPWCDIRDQITGVYFDEGAPLEIESIAYWFSDCENLAFADIPGFVREIGYHAFYNCSSLHDLCLCYEDTTPVIIQGAFVTNHHLEWQADYDPRLQISLSSANSEALVSCICAYDWGADGCPVHSSSGSGVALYAVRAAASAYAVSYCSYCKGTYSYTVDYEQWTDDVHCIRYWCSNCGYDQCGGANAGSHTYNSSGYCTLCGYYNSAYDQSSVCYHYSTYKTWSGCDWTEYCSDCGAYIDSGTSHGSTYTTWNGCNWYEYCNDCGQLMDSGVSHNYVYGSWQYYNTSQHRRTGTCTSCGATTYSYGYHSTTTKYSPYDSTQHSYGRYCSTCGSYVGSVSYANHSFTYGAWQNYSGTQHRRLKICSICGYNEYEYSSHSLSYGSWSNYSATQHRRTVSCATCGYSSYEYASHSTTAGSWSSISATQHQRTLSCSCGYSTTETAAHSLTYSAWQNYSTTQHRRTVSCSVCGYSTYEYANHSITNGAWASISDTQHQRTSTCSCGYSKTETGVHNDADNDGYCDDCDYLMTRFSVTVPASLTLVVSKTGEVYSANNAAIVNNSTGAVEVTDVTVTTANGWTLAPYSTNMANAKVDTKLIGFALNGAATVNASTSESLTLSGDWAITKGGSLPLAYDAVVSAMSEPVSEQVLTIVFVLDWAVR